MNTQRSRKPKSPPVPSRNLEDCVKDARELYKEFTHGTFSRAEVASTLGVSSASGPFAQRLFSLREFGVIEGTPSAFRVSENFKKINATGADTPEFKAAAFAAVKSAGTFRDLLVAFPNKLPSKETIASRLENEKKFNPDRARQAAQVLEESLRYAGVLDGNNNILPIRESPQNAPSSDEPDETHDFEEPSRERGANLRTEIPVGSAEGGRKVVVHYPPDLTGDEATKVGNVLKAIVT
jgi:hypothetical protein